LPPNEVIRLGRETALALDYAHRRGVIHLDIKPENILLQEGHAVVADFGIARAIRSAGDEVRAGAPIFGTPPYMSPEQALGLPDVDGRSDVYSLGCVLYEMITGEQPFANQRGRSIPNVTALTRYVSRELADVVMRAMAPVREERFGTTAELARALGGVGRRRRLRRVRRSIYVVAASLALMASFVGLWTSRGAAASDDVLAVAPFDVESPSLALWREGLVDVLSRRLDGAGALRAVPASMVMRVWSGRSDAQSARALGVRTGARLVLFGDLLTAGDSVRASVTLLDTKTGHMLAEIDQRDVARRMDRLSDSLAVAVLRELGQLRRSNDARR
jgi:serine/threonine-protein kinase